MYRDWSIWHISLFLTLMAFQTAMFGHSICLSQQLNGCLTQASSNCDPESWSIHSPKPLKPPLCSLILKLYIQHINGFQIERFSYSIQSPQGSLTHLERSCVVSWEMPGPCVGGFSTVDLNGKMLMEFLKAARLCQKTQTMLFVVCWVVVPHRWLVVVGGDVGD